MWAPKRFKMTYLQALSYLNSFINYEKKDSYSYQESFRLERVEGFLRLLGNPQDGLKCLHIAGTKGKGSVCVFAANILRAAGYKVGLYTSPHLLDVRERIRVLTLMNHEPVRSEAEPPRRGRTSAERSGASPKETNHDFEGMISQRELVALVERIRPAIGKYDRVYKDEALTFFEVFTALAFLYFKEKKVDYAVLETGLGGRLDATNVVYPLVCGITPISYDHTQYLGNTLKQIAGEKAGIIKSRQLSAVSRQQIVISALQEKEAQEVIRKRCVRKKARLYEIGRDIIWQERGFESGPQSFDLQGIKQRYDNLKIRLLGKHQLANAALAVGMVEALGDHKIKPAHIRGGLKEAIWPGRLEVVSLNPFVVLDGAQNAASALALKEAIKDNFRGLGYQRPNRGLMASYQRLILVLGMSRDKDIPGVCRQFSDFCDIVILTKSANPRAAHPRLLAGYFFGKEIVVADSVKKALSQAKAVAQKKDLILVTGSLFVVGEVLNA